MDMQNLYLVDKQREYIRIVTEHQTIATLVKQFSEQFRAEKRSTTEPANYRSRLARYLANRS